MVIKIILLVILIVIWILAVVAAGLTSQFARLVNDGFRFGYWGSCDNTQGFATGGAVFHWLCWLVLVRELSLSCTCSYSLADPDLLPPSSVELQHAQQVMG